MAARNTKGKALALKMYDALSVAPQAEEKAQKSAKPWFMFGKDGQ